MSARYKINRSRRGGFSPAQVQVEAVSAVGSSNVESFAWQPLDPYQLQQFLFDVTDRGSTEYAALGLLGDPDGVLAVTFLNGATYQYAPVPLSVFQGMLNAGSRGRYVWNVVRQYPFVGPL